MKRRNGDANLDGFLLQGLQLTELFHCGLERLALDLPFVPEDL